MHEAEETVRARLALVETVAEALRAQGAMLATAESCTGGGVAQTLTMLPGSSHWFERGFVTYTNLSKQELLDVPEAILARYGAVSEDTARAMAEGALAHSHADYALSVTGIAGPGGGSTEKPVGMVCFAWAGNNHITLTETCYFLGDREQVRMQSVDNALRGLLTYLRAAMQG